MLFPTIPPNKQINNVNYEWSKNLLDSKLFTIVLYFYIFNLGYYKQ